MSEKVEPVVYYRDSETGGDAYLLWKISVERLGDPHRYGVVVNKNGNKELFGAGINEEVMEGAKRDALNEYRGQDVTVVIEERQPLAL